MNSSLLEADPNESSSRKLEQLSVNEALHQAYVRGYLKKRLLSYYLNFMHSLRTDMLLHLNGEAGQNIPLYLMTRLPKLLRDSLYSQIEVSILMHLLILMSMLK